MSLLPLFIPLALWLIPVQQSTAAYGVILPPESSLVRSNTSGFISALPVVNDQRVHQGEALVQMQNDELHYLALVESARLTELEAEFRLALVNRTGAMELLKDEVENQKARLTQVKEDSQNLTVVSPGDGLFRAISNQIIVGRWVKRGTVIGVVSGSRNWTATVLNPQSSIDLLNQAPEQIHALTFSTPGTTVPAKRGGQTPRATLHLPQQSLGSAHGGPIPVDLSDTSGTKLLKPMFQVDVLLPAATFQTGQTVLVWFLHEKTPLGPRIWRWATARLAMSLEQYQIML